MFSQFRVFYFILVVVLLSGCMQKRLPYSSQFTEESVLYGTTTTKEECNQRVNTVWVESEGAQECISYYASGLKKDNPVVLVHVHGDVAWAEYFRSRVTHVESAYMTMNSSRLHSISQKTFLNTKIPFIYLARPGTFGSTGFHGDRHKIKNPRLINAALDAIKTKHNIGKYSLSGQSGGGTVVASILNWRNDIKCAVLASSAGAVWDRLNTKYLGWNSDKYKQLIYDPSHHIDEMPIDKNRKIIVIGDTEDDNVQFTAQKSYADRVKAAGHSVRVLKATATDKRRHDLANQAVFLAAQCTKNNVDIAGSERKKLKEKSAFPTEMQIEWANLDINEKVQVKSFNHNKYLSFKTQSPKLKRCSVRTITPQQDTETLLWELSCNNRKRPIFLT